MKAEELRIGNLFKEAHSKELLRVIELSENRITFNGIQEGKWQAKAIPLTEDWLLKFGFEVDRMSKWGGWLSPRFDLGSQIRIRDYSDYFKMQKAKIKYVHQLQNLYFALTQKELTIK